MVEEKDQFPWVVPAPPHKLHAPPKPGQTTMDRLWGGEGIDDPQSQVWPGEYRITSPASSCVFPADGYRQSVTQPMDAMHTEAADTPAREWRPRGPPES